LASEKHTFPKPFSRVKNDLAEVQKWWPGYVVADSQGGLSVDPVLFRSQFGELTIEDEGAGLNTEANTPGIRVEAVNDDGTDVSGTEPTLQILNSGSFNPRAILTHNDGSSTEIVLIAPSSERKNNSTSLGTLTAAPPLDPTDEYNTDTAGPYPIFMTLQEFADLIDSWRHHSGDDSNKPAFLPHGLIGRTVSASSAWPALQADPRTTSNNPLPTGTDYVYRATVFMPMLLDNNQMANTCSGNSYQISTLNLETEEGSEEYAGGFDVNITRYNPHPVTGDTSSVIYKCIGNSGDHIVGAVASASHRYKDTPISFGSWLTNDQSPDSTAAYAPKYRMKMALACFLKDGTYSLNDGVIIPYSYDPDRYIGGTVTTTLYAVWDGDNGYGSDGDSTAESTFTNSGIYTTQYPNDRSAQIYPMFDFVQGPLNPSAMGGNFDFSIVEGTERGWVGLRNALSGQSQFPQPRMTMVRPNPVRAPIVAVETVVAPTGSAGRWFNVYVEYIGNPLEYKEGASCLFISGLTGDLGSGATNVGEPWPSVEETSGAYNVTGYDFNGWWVANEVTDLGAVDMSSFCSDYTGGSLAFVQKFTIWVQAGNITTVTCYKPDRDAYVQQGLVGRHTTQNPLWDTSGFGGSWGNPPEGLDHGSGATADGFMPTRTASVTFGLSTPGFSNAPQFTTTPFVPYNPGRVIHAYLDHPNTEGSFLDSTKYALRDLRIYKASDLTFPTAPMQSNTGGGVLRIPGSFVFGLSDTKPTRSGTSTSGSLAVDGDDYSTLDLDALATQWSGKSVWTPLWSYMEHATGNHGYDMTLPSGSHLWGVGRNRPFPAHERVGTALGAGINRHIDTEHTNDYGTMEMGCSPVALDIEMRCVIPRGQDRLFIMEFDGNETHPNFGRHSMLKRTTKRDLGLGIFPIYDGSGDMTRVNNTGPSGAALGQDYQSLPRFSVNRPAVWAVSQSGFNDKAEYNNAFEYTAENYISGFGMLGDGAGKTATIGAGYHTIRTLFNEGGQTLLVDGANAGTDPNAPATVWGLSINVCDLISMTTEEDLQGRTDGAGESSMKVARSSRHDDLQIDEMVMRQIPSPSMLPFDIDTTKVDISDIARYTRLRVEVDNVSANTGMNIKVSIHEAETGGGIARSAGSVVSNFELLDLNILGGEGSVDLTTLPASIVSDGFQVRFHFYIPDSTQTELHPINWNALPIIRSWTVEYDIAPTATLACTGNTFNGDTSSPITTKVGHILSFRGTGTTTDPDRTISEVKFDFGDGNTTDWILFPDQTQTTNTFDISHAYIVAGTYDAVAYVKDDNGNISAASTALSITVSNTKPVAILRATPTLVRAGNALRFVGSESYSPASGVTISDYEFAFGDGSSNVSGSTTNTQHTYATAGEYLATLVVTDSNGDTSNTTSVVVKVLPATLVVPLVLNTKPSSFQRRRTSTFSVSPILDAVYPEVSDTGSRSDEFVLTGTFLTETANLDIEFMEELLQSGALVEFEWEDVNFAGTPTGKTFVGRMTAFDYQRQGGQHGQTPYSATFLREAGLGA
jgi:PKD repeat protein